MEKNEIKDSLSFDIIDVAKNIAKEKGIDEMEVIEAMEMAIAKAGRTKYGFELDMWTKSDGTKIYNLKKKINSMNLSNDASDIYKKILLTNTFPPKDNLDKKKFFDLKAEWLIKNGDLDLIIEYVTKNLDIISNENL